jgi:hypothetical protein
MPVEGMPYFVGHAWLSRDGIVYDPVKGKECPAGEYPGVALHRYTAEQAARMMLERGIYGPWEEDVPH